LRPLSLMPKVISAVRFAAFAMVATVLTGEAAATTSRAMQFHCTLVPEYSKGDLSKDDAAIAARLKPFMPEPGAPSLRITSMEQQIEVASAIQTIRATCHDYRAGHTPESEADSILSAAEEVIQNFEQKLANEAKIRAAGGQVAQMDSIRAVLTAMASAGRQNALLGEDMLADAAWHMMVETAEVFDDAFGADCMNQTFDQGIALSLERQRELLSISSDLSHCAYRYGEAKAELGAVLSITWRTCGNVDGKWKVKVKGMTVGEGSGVIGADGEGEYTAHFTKKETRQADITDNGTLTYACQSSECDCLYHPARPECAGVDTSKAEWSLIAKEGKSFTGTIYMPTPRVHGPVVWENFSVADPRLHHSELWEGYLIKVIRVDKPCDPDHIEIP
jgi:hypothetical protein